MTMDLKHLTYDTYLAMPEMKQRYSIIDGELVMAASPTPDLQTIVQETFMKLDALVREVLLGVVPKFDHSITQRECRAMIGREVIEVVARARQCILEMVDDELLDVFDLRREI